MSLAFNTSGTVGIASGSGSISLSSVTTGALMIVYIIEAGAEAPKVSTTGWTLLFSTADSSNFVGHCAYWRVKASGDSSVSVTSGTGGTPILAELVSYTGQAASNPVDISSSATGSNSAPTAPSVTTTVARDWLVGVQGQDSATAESGPSGFTQRVNVTNSTATCQISAYDESLGAAGATGSTAWASTTADWTAGNIAISPAASSYDPSSSRFPDDYGTTDAGMLSHFLILGGY